MDRSGRIWRRLGLGLTLWLGLAGRLAAGEAAADQAAGKDFWDGNSRYHQCWWKSEEALAADKDEARKQKRKPKYEGVEELKLRMSIYGEAASALGSGAGYAPWKQIFAHTLLRWQIDLPADQSPATADLERAVRTWWQAAKSNHCPASFEDPRRRDWDGSEFPLGDFAALYNRYSREKKWGDAARIAQEMVEQYGWAWEVREWRARLIDAQMRDGSGVEAACANIDGFVKDYLDQIEVNDAINRQGHFLIVQKRWAQAVTLLTAALKTYQGCDWEPEFIKLGVECHLAVAAAGGDQVAAAAELAAECDRRAREVYPHSPATADAVVAYFDWALKGPAREKAASVVSAYLQANPESPAWDRLWTRGQELVKAGQAEWAALEAVGAKRRAVQGGREAELAGLVAAQGVDDYLTNLAEFVKKYPDSVPARKAAAAMIDFLNKPELVMFAKENLKAVTMALKDGFGRSPEFRSESLERVGDLFAHPFADFVYRDLIAHAPSKLQKEYYYYRNARRSRNQNTYSLPALEAWQGAFPDSYMFPEITRDMCWWAWEEQNPACAQMAKLLAKERYYNSLDAYGVLGHYINYYSALQLKRSQTREPEKFGTEQKPSSLYKKLSKELAVAAGQLANQLDKAFKDKQYTGRLYFLTARWGDELKFKARGDQAGRDVLRKDYSNAYYYYQARAYEK